MSFLNNFNVSGHSRRSFWQMTAAFPLLLSPKAQAAGTEANVLGPVPGQPPQIGTLISELNWMRGAVLQSVKGMKQDQLDFLLDSKANRIGALLLHLAATEKLYQLNTFNNVGPKDIYNDAAFKEWVLPMELGDSARQAIKGHNLDYYLNVLHEGREKTLTELRQRDDQWLLTIDKNWPWGPTNNLCKWFHVCEHESHHTGQISLLKGRAQSRAPAAKSANG